MTTRQKGALIALSMSSGPVSARHIGVRSDVLWRLEERGLVARNAHEQWYIRDAGRRALEATE